MLAVQVTRSTKKNSAVWRDPPCHEVLGLVVLSAIPVVGRLLSWNRVLCPVYLAIGRVTGLCLPPSPGVTRVVI